MFLSGMRARAEVYFCVLHTSCLPASFFETRIVVSLYKNLQMAFRRWVSPMYYLEVSTVQILACQLDQCRTEIAPDY